MPRSSGVLLHPTSLPGTGGIGEIGGPAVRFLDSLARMGQSWWQMLPVGPTGYADSPYQSPSTFAGNPLIIDIQHLVEHGLLTHDETNLADVVRDRVHYGAVIRSKGPLLARAAERMDTTGGLSDEFDAFRHANGHWLTDYALYGALKEAHDMRAWPEWDTPVRDRRPDALEEATRSLGDAIRRMEILQFLFDKQWRHLRREASSRGIGLIGDIPIFVAHDSADVWTNRHLFDLDEVGQPRTIAGVPPDYFSETGQRWGNPLYLWERHGADGYEWWVRRLRHVLERFDVVRVDHFRGFVDYWEIPVSAPTAVGGHWARGPGAHFFDEVGRHLPAMPIIAEDLGIITDEVTALREQFGFPGMRVLQFGFDVEEADTNLHHPDLYDADVVAYTGTHDNDTAIGWFWKDHPRRDPGSLDIGRHRLVEAADCPIGEIHWGMVSLVASSAAATAIFPVQDLLGLDSEARMNTPATMDGNWAWRMSDHLTPAIEERLATITTETVRG